MVSKENGGSVVGQAYNIANEETEVPGGGPFRSGVYRSPGVTYALNKSHFDELRTWLVPGVIVENAVPGDKRYSELSSFGLVEGPAINLTTGAPIAGRGLRGLYISDGTYIALWKENCWKEIFRMA